MGFRGTGLFFTDVADDTTKSVDVATGTAVAYYAKPEISLFSNITLAVTTTAFSGTLDIQGAVQVAGVAHAYQNVRYVTEGGDGPLAAVNDQLSFTTSSTTVYYRILGLWDMVKVLLTRSAGSVSFSWIGLASDTPTALAGTNGVYVLDQTGVWRGYQADVQAGSLYSATTRFPLTGLVISSNGQGKFIQAMAADVDGVTSNILAAHPYLYNGTNSSRAKSISAAAGIQNVATEFSYNNISTATTTTVKSGAGTLHAITVNTTAAGAVTIYDNTAGSGTKIGTMKASIAEGTYVFDVAFGTGLTIVTAGASDLTVSYL